MFFKISKWAQLHSRRESSSLEEKPKQISKGCLSHKHLAVGLGTLACCSDRIYYILTLIFFLPGCVWGWGGGGRRGDGRVQEKGGTEVGQPIIILKKRNLVRSVSQLVILQIINWLTQRNLFWGLLVHVTQFYLRNYWRKQILVLLGFSFLIIRDKKGLILTGKPGLPPNMNESHYFFPPE